MLPEHMRETSRMELLYEDIEKLPVSEIARIAEWLTEKVDSLTTKTRAEPKEAEEEVGGAARQWQLTMISKRAQEEVTGAGTAAMSSCQAA